MAFSDSVVETKQQVGTVFTFNFEGGIQGASVNPGDTGSGSVMPGVVGSAATYDNTYTAHGLLAGKIFAQPSVVNYFDFPFSVTNDGFCRGYFTFDNVLASGNVLGGFHGGAPVWLITQSGSNLQIQGSTTVTLATLVPGTVYRIEWHYNSLALLDVKFFVGDTIVAQSEVNTVPGTAGSLDEIRFYGSSQTENIWWDDLVVNATSFPGPATGVMTRRDHAQAGAPLFPGNIFPSPTLDPGIIPNQELSTLKVILPRIDVANSVDVSNLQTSGGTVFLRTETGTSADISSLRAQPASTGETGMGSEVTKEKHYGTDTGTTSDISITRKDFNRTDTGSGIDIANLGTAKLSRTDTAHGVDGSSLKTLVPRTDTAHGSDVSVFHAAYGRADTGSSNELESQKVPQNRTDSGIGLDQSIVLQNNAQLLRRSEFGFGTDVSTEKVSLTRTESGLGTDKAVRPFNRTDSGTSTDASLLVRRMFDFGHATDTSSIKQGNFDGDTVVSKAVISAVEVFVTPLQDTQGVISKGRIRTNEEYHITPKPKPHQHPDTATIIGAGVAVALEDFRKLRLQRVP